MGQDERTNRDSAQSTDADTSSAATGEAGQGTSHFNVPEEKISGSTGAALTGAGAPHSGGSAGGGVVLDAATDQVNANMTSAIDAARQTSTSDMTDTTKSGVGAGGTDIKGAGGAR